MVLALTSTRPRPSTPGLTPFCAGTPPDLGPRRRESPSRRARRRWTDAFLRPDGMVEQFCTDTCNPDW